MLTPRIPAVRAAVEILGEEGVGTVFGSPGATALPWYGALERAGGPRLLMGRHEQGATHMADGWARTDGRTGVVVAAPEGAGRDGLFAGLRTAHADAVPLVCLTGRTTEEAPAAGLAAAARRVTKRAVRVDDPARIPRALREAFRTAREGRPGPVLVDLPYGTAEQYVRYDAEAEERGAPSGDGRWTAHQRDPGTAHGSRTVCRAIDEAVAADAYVVTDAALRRFCGARPRMTTGARRYVVCGRDGPPGWQVPAAVGVRTALDALGRRDTEVVALVREHELPYAADALSVAAQHGLPFVLAAIGPDGRSGTEAVRLMRAYGCSGHRVGDPADLRSAVAWARKEAVTTARPALLAVTAPTADEGRADARAQALVAGVPRQRTAPGA
ncbi:thiamine pyrophosphate-binding protein [Streptomyces sp. NPDC018045]|uniref:thiamine pyrophosphate-binding protein n=1 Tax=Streptomyces sp. NPDC018045 TaxID=3365037 RepID=UPI0037A0713E